MGTEQEPGVLKTVDDFLEEIHDVREVALRDIQSGKYGRPTFLANDGTEAERRPEIIFLVQLGDPSNPCLVPLFDLPILCLVPLFDLHANARGQRDRR